MNYSLGTVGQDMFNKNISNMYNGLGTVTPSTGSNNNNFKGLGSFYNNGTNFSMFPSGASNVSYYRIGNNVMTPDEFSKVSPNLFTSQTVEALDSNMNPIASGNMGSLFSQYYTPVTQGLNTVAGLWQAYNAWNQNSMLQDQLDFQKDYANRSLANQAKMVNNAYDSAAEIALGMNDTLSEKQREERRALAKKKHIDGSAIG